MWPPWKAQSLVSAVHADSQTAMASTDIRHQHKHSGNHGGKNQQVQGGQKKTEPTFTAINPKVVMIFT